MTSLDDIRNHLRHHNMPRPILDLIDTHVFADEYHRAQLDQLSPTSVDRMFVEMKRALLLDQAKKELRELASSTTAVVAKDRCNRCDITYYYDLETSTNVCPQCGTSMFVLENNLIDFNSLSRYNRNNVHNYAHREHFFQTLCDVTCTGDRTIPDEVMRHCAATLGRGPHVTFADVFDTLQRAGYARYYSSKYYISACLRGSSEVNLTRRELEMVRGHYNRYDRQFSEFQRAYKLGKRTIRGKWRLYWPVRFIMAEMFKLIGRHDLVSRLRGVSSPRREKRYREHWAQLRAWVEKTAPKPNSRGPSIPPQLIRLTASKRGG